MTVHVSIKTQNKGSYLSGSMYVAPDLTSVSHITLSIFYCMFLLIIKNTELPCLAEICYMVGYSLGSMSAISFNKNILESILSSNLCECFYLPDDLGRIH